MTRKPHFPARSKRRSVSRQQLGDDQTAKKLENSSWFEQVLRASRAWSHGAKSQDRNRPKADVVMRFVDGATDRAASARAITTLCLFGLAAVVVLRSPLVELGISICCLIVYLRSAPRKWGANVSFDPKVGSNKNSA